MWIIWHQHKVLVSVTSHGLRRKHTKVCGTFCLTMVGSSDNVLFKIGEKLRMLLMTIFSKNLTSFGVSKASFGTHSNLVITWKVGPWMGIVS